MHQDKNVVCQWQRAGLRGVNLKGPKSVHVFIGVQWWIRFELNCALRQASPVSLKQTCHITNSYLSHSSIQSHGKRILEPDPGSER